MDPVPVLPSWQDTFVFCLQPNFKDDLWLFMIFAAIQVSLAGLKLTSFFINRWARGSKVGSGDDDEDNVGDDGASGGISIMGVLTLIAGALILAAYCDDEPDEKTFNIFKAGVYLNTFLFAVALIFICGLVAAFVIDIITRRRGRSITFRMFLGGTIVLSIAASFFGATGIMGLKYIQNECYEEVDLYLNKPTTYLATKKNFANEIVQGKFSEPTKEILYGKYPGQVIGDPVIFTRPVEDEIFYVYSTIYNETSWTRHQILDLKVHTTEYTYNSDGDIIGLNFLPTNARCFDTSEGFGEVNGLMRCAIHYTMPNQNNEKYEQATNQIVDRYGCAHTEEDIVCDKGSDSFPLCCEQFADDHTKTKGCHCINNPTDASCGFKESLTGCIYERRTLNIAIPKEKEYFCDNYSSVFCSTDSNGIFNWDSLCSTGTEDQQYECCKSKIVKHTWYQYGNPIDIDMTPKACTKYKNCYSADQFYDNCCASASNTDCTYCKSATITTTNEDDHSLTCGYDCFESGSTIQEQRKCCDEAKRIFGLTFEENTECGTVLTYDPCDDANSLGCKSKNTECSEDKDCFPKCCEVKKFDFTNEDTIKESVASDCFQLASELISRKNDDKSLLGHYIYHKTGAKPDKRASCKKVNGIIDPKCCNGDETYSVDDPCHCYGSSSLSTRCKKVHHSECYPTVSSNGNLSGAFPQCCYDIGDFFGPDHSCACRFQENLTEEIATCNKASSSTTAFEFIQNCPNPCKDTDKALIPNSSLICEKPIFELY